MAVLPTGIGPVTGGYQIERSLRFNGADDAYVSRTFGTPTSNKKWTYSVWMKRSAFAANQAIMSSNVDGAEYWDMRFNTSDQILVQNRVGSSNLLLANTTAVYRDPSAWYHIVFVFDSDNATPANRNLLYVNNVNYTLSANSGSGNASAWNVNSVQHNIGVSRTLTTGGGIWSEFNGYQTEVNFIDGQALTPSSFGETDTNTGVWKPKAYSGTYGTNGFYLKFADNSGTTSTTLGKDSSGNGNNWTPNNFSVTAGSGNDSLVDSPTAYGTDTGVGGEVRGNYATLNPLDNGGNTVSNGNLVVTVVTGFDLIRSTMFLSSGKWYWEITCDDTGEGYLGVSSAAESLNQRGGETNDSAVVRTTNGDLRTNSTNSAYGSAVADGNVMMFALDMDAGKFWAGKQGTWFNSGDPAAGTNAGKTGLTVPVSPSISVYDNEDYTANFGQRAFAYTAPSGFKALCTTNLPTPTIGATSTTQAGKYFNPVLYTGNGTSSRSITGVGFAPDFVWVKNRSGANSHGLYDTIRGATKSLYSNSTSTEQTDVNSLTAFGSDGFTVGTDGIVNTNTSSYVSWNWNAGGSNATNTSGTITSTVRANTTAGFSIISYTGNKTSGATIGHGLSVAPAMVIIKERANASEWIIYHTSLGATQSIYFSTAAANTNSIWFNNTAPSSTVITLGNADGTNRANTMIAYAFAPVAGYSAFGSFTGNGSTDGPFVYTGFRPRFVLYKSATEVASWAILDTSRSTYNVADKYLNPNLSDAEGTFNLIDINSNGFKVRNSNGGNNLNGATYIYAAFAESPFKYSLAR